MRYFPAGLNLSEKKIVVIGGGSVAARKALSLLQSGGSPLVIAPRLARSFLRFKRKIRHLARRYRAGDLKGVFLAVDATGEAKLHEIIRQEARREGVLLNVVDRPALCDFIFPAIVRRGDFVISVSTGGASPAFARKIRRRLGRLYGPEYGRLARILEKVRLEIPAGERVKYRAVFRKVAHWPLLRRIQKGDGGGVKKLIEREIRKKRGDR
ncbi:MAG: bifunctional precorrin-2 dehydrogenase/sirohydrochlorin ferrochelatase [Deltaproteobacteria bacterium]|nr:bifunctional precorrin-2 dehydrogenase/sirohydrochlorin ferrochelatase [Deltaproteobacteria bacterium]